MELGKQKAAILIDDHAGTKAVGFRGYLSAILDKRWFEPAIIAVIVFNAIMIGLETDKGITARYGSVMETLDKIVMTIFVVEISMRLIVHGRSFWRNPWNLFDFTIVAITLVPATGNLSILRSLRILRALRLVSAVPAIRRVVAGLLTAIPGMGAVLMLLLLLVYISAVLATKLFAEAMPSHFGTIWSSAFTLFQIMTLEGWSENVVRPVMKEIPYAWLFFLPFIVISTFMVLNLFLGIVVDAISQQNESVEEHVIDAVDSDHEKVMKELASLRAQVVALNAALAPKERRDTKES